MGSISNGKSHYRKIHETMQSRISPSVSDRDVLDVMFQDHCPSAPPDMNSPDCTHRRYEVVQYAEGGSVVSGNDGPKR